MPTSSANPLLLRDFVSHAKGKVTHLLCFLAGPAPFAEFVAALAAYAAKGVVDVAHIGNLGAEASRGLLRAEKSCVT